MAFLESNSELLSVENMSTGGLAIGVFDTFETEVGRRARLNGDIPAAPAEHGWNLLAKEPDIRLIELIAVKQS